MRTELLKDFSAQCECVVVAANSLPKARAPEQFSTLRLFPFTTSVDHSVVLLHVTSLWNTGLKYSQKFVF